MFLMELPAVAHALDADNALILDCMTGNIDAYGVLVARHRDGIYNFVRHTVGLEADAQDIAQEVFVNAYGALHRFRRGAPFQPWLYKIAANLCRSYFRQSKRRPCSIDGDFTISLIPAPQSTDPSAAVLREDECRRLRHAIRSLPYEQRMVVVLRHWRECSYREISIILAIPVTTVEHRLRSARHVLREQLDDTSAGERRQ